MRTVLYAHQDMEPITVIDVPMGVWEYLDRHGYAKVPIFPKCKPPEMACNPAKPEPTRWAYVHIRSERIHRNGVTRMILFTDDETDALLLKAAFLPGQISDMQDQEKYAFAAGFLAGLQALA